MKIRNAIWRLSRMTDAVHKRNVVVSCFSGEVRNLGKLRGIGRGQRCVIMGNGPSLKQIDPKPLRKEITFGTNAVYLIQDWLGFLPTYHVTEDTLVIEDRGKEISEMIGPVKFYSDKFIDKIPPHGQVIHPNIIYDYTEYSNFPAFSRNAAKRIWTGGTVSYLCLQLAYFMEFEQVIMIGFDHNYIKPTHVTTNDRVWTSHGDDPNHIHPDYFGKGKRWHDPNVGRMESAYVRAREEFTRVGRTILNATVGGKLEVFPRADYVSLFPSQPNAAAP